MKVLITVLVITLSSNCLAKTESWYLCLGGGGSTDTFPAPVQELFDSLIDQGAEGLSLMVDISFYWPILTDSTMIGIGMTGNQYSLELNGSQTYFNTNLYGLSLAHFLGSEVGSGLYLRMDYGLVKGSYSVDQITLLSPTGNGFFVEAGWGFAISSGTRLLLSYYYSSKTIDPDSYKAHGVKLSFLF